MVNWEQLILRAIVPFSFVAIWALTALFNRESKGFPARPPGSTPPVGPRPGEPTIRWAPPPAPSPRRASLGDDEILVISNDPNRPTRMVTARPGQGGGRRPPKGRQPAPPARKIEPVMTRPRLAGVTQNVNQTISRTLELTPLTSLAPMPASAAELARAPSVASTSSAVVTTTTLRPLLNDPVRLREAFILNEVLRPPVTMRGRRGYHG
jgi:hypothetical protein